MIIIGEVNKKEAEKLGFIIFSEEKHKLRVFIELLIYKIEKIIIF